MNAGPLLLRELRAEVRQPANAWLRAGGAAVVLAVLALLVFGGHGLALRSGGRVFHQLNLTLFAAIWLIGPLLTADCISRERREGTLGLLFLTPLKPRDIVLAKSLVHALRALSLWLAAVPVLAVPLLAGGVTWMDLARAVLLDFGALALALTTGLLASCCCREWSRANLLALGLSVLSGSLFVSLHGAFLVWQWLRLSVMRLSGGTPQFFPLLWSYLQSRAIAFLSPASGGDVPFYFVWSGRGGGGANLRSVGLAAALWLFALLVGLLVVWLATRRVRTAWKEQPPSKHQHWCRQVFCTPALGRDLFRRYRRAALERNPIGWLQGYSWSARLCKWGWCLGLLLAECALFAGTAWGWHLDLQEVFGGLLALGVALSASTSFHRERQTGAMELILVTPLRVRQIILGRLRGLWSQFLPSVVLLLGIWFYLVESRQAIHFRDTPTAYGFPLWLGLTFLTLPVVGLYFSLRDRHIVVKWLWTCAAGILAPWLLANLLMAALIGPREWSVLGLLPHFMVVVYGALGAGMAGQLARDLTRRSFVRQRAASA